MFSYVPAGTQLRSIPDLQIANSYRCSFCLSEVSWLSEISHVLSFIPPQPNSLIALVFQDTTTCAASGCTQMQSAAKRTRPLVLKRRSISWETVNVQTVQKCVAGCLYWSLKKKWGNELTGFRGQLTANLTAKCFWGLPLEGVHAIVIHLTGVM